MNRQALILENAIATGGANWFCIRTQPKREHIAARHLKTIPEVDLFNPQLRSRKLTTRGPVWFTESLFPNYLFARFELSSALEEVKFTPSVSCVIRFGDRYPAIPESVIADLRKNFGEEALQLSTEIPSEGDKVTLTVPRFHGVQATVLRVMPAKQRVQVLLDMLGRTTPIELSLHAVVAERKPLPGSLYSSPA